MKSNVTNNTTDAANLKGAMHSYFVSGFTS